MPIIGNAVYPENQSGIGEVLKQVLSGVGSYNQGKQDRAYRKAAAKLMGVPEEDLGYFQRDELKDLIKEKMKSQYNPKEWKPSSKEEALEIAAAKKITKTDDSAEKAKAKAESDMRNNYGKYIIAAEKIGNKPKSFEEFKKMFEPAPAANLGNEADGIAKAKAAADRVLAEGAANKPRGIGGILQKILGGASQLGNNVKPMNPLEGFINMIRPQQGAVTAPVSTAVPPEVAQPEEIAPAAAPVTDPIAQRIQEALAEGMDPKELARMLQEKGIDPATYGL